MTFTVQEFSRTLLSSSNINYTLSGIPDFLIIVVTNAGGSSPDPAYLTWGGLSIPRLLTAGTGSGPAGSGRASIDFRVLDVRNIAVPTTGIITTDLTEPLQCLALYGAVAVNLLTPPSYTGSPGTFPTVHTAPYGTATLVGISKRASTTITSNKTNYAQVSTNGTDHGAVLALRGMDDTSDYVWSPTSAAFASIGVYITTKRSAQTWPAVGRGLTKPPVLPIFVGAGDYKDDLYLGAVGTSVSLAQPVGTQVGDLLTACVWGRNAGGLLTPAGWTKVGESYTTSTDQYTAVYTRLAATAGAASHTLALQSVSGRLGGLILGVRSSAGFASPPTATILATSGNINTADRSTTGSAGGYLVATAITDVSDSAAATFDSADYRVNSGGFNLARAHLSDTDLVAGVPTPTIDGRRGTTILSANTLPVVTRHDSGGNPISQSTWAAISVGFRNPIA